MNANHGTAGLTCWLVRLKLRGPLLTTSSAPLGFGIDAPFARNAAGEYYLSGTLVKGRLKESWQELSEAEGGGAWNWKRWLGKEPPRKEPPEGGAEDWTSERGVLQFTDFPFQQAGSDPVTEHTITYRIERDRETRSVSRGQNLMIESPFAAGAEYWFEGRVWGIVSEDEAAVVDVCLRQGLCFTPVLGAETTVGFGVITGVEVARVIEWEKGSGWNAPQGERWGLVLSPEGPLCLAGRRLAENIFESEAEISGGVVKGALASLIQQLNGGTGRDVAAGGEAAYKELREEFSNLRVLHGKAVKKGALKRPGVVPLSAVRVGKEFWDAAFLKELPVKGDCAPAFRVDWKRPEEQEADALFGVVHPPRELRVRTQIETAARRAKDANLFAYRMLAPRALNGKKEMEEYEWLAEVLFHGVDAAKRTQVKVQLADLLERNGLPGVGKLKTRCVASLAEVEPAMPVAGNKGAQADLWVVTLQTPALLCDVSQMGAGLSDAAAAYESYWREPSNGVFELVYFQVSQRLAGGGYLWKEFTAGDVYRPYLLTEAGSTFVLRGGPEAKVRGWQERGLPVADTVRTAFGLTGDSSDWQRCPYVPENGFGEVAVDLAWHWERPL